MPFRAGQAAHGLARYVRSEHGFIQGDPSRWRLKRALSGGGSLMDMGIYALQAARYANRAMTSLASEMQLDENVAAR